MKILLILLLISMSFVSCGSKASDGNNKSRKNAQEIILPEPEIQIEDLVIQTSRNFNIPNNRLVSIGQNRFNRLSQEEKITAKIIDLDFKKYLDDHGNRQRRSLKEKMQQYLTEVNNLKSNFSNSQMLMEEILTRQISNNILYHYTKNNIFDIFESQRLQCQSAAHLYLITQRTAQDAHDPKNVIIFTPGHILPGKIVWDKNHYKLIGIETTLASNNEIDFGDTSNIDLPIRIVMASDYALILANKENLVSPATQIQTVLQRSAELFGFNLERSERNIHEHYQNQIGDLFSFGADTRLSEDSSRQNQSVLDSQNYFTSFLAYKRIQENVNAQTNNNTNGLYNYGQEQVTTTHILNIHLDNRQQGTLALAITSFRYNSMEQKKFDFYSSEGNLLGSCRGFINRNYLQAQNSMFYNNYVDIFTLREFSRETTRNFLGSISYDGHYERTECHATLQQIYSNL